MQKETCESPQTPGTLPLDPEKCLTLLSDFSHRALNASDIHTLFDITGTTLIAIFGFNCVVFFRSRPKKEDIFLEHISRVQKQTVQFQESTLYSLAQKVISEQEIMHEFLDQSGREAATANLNNAHLSTIIAVPLQCRGQKLGAVLCVIRGKRIPSSRELNLLKSVSVQTAGAMAMMSSLPTASEKNGFIPYVDHILQSIIKTAPVTIALLRDRKFCWVSESVLEMTGYDESELLGQDIELLYANKAEYQRIGRLIYSRLHDTPPQSVETRLRRKDGVLVDVLIRVTPLDKEDISKGVIGIALDITDLKAAQKNSADKTAQLQTIFNAIHHAIIFMDLNWKIRMVNPAFYRLFRYSKKEITGRSTAFLFKNQTDYTVQRLKSDSISASYFHKDEILYLRKNGETFPGETVTVPVRDNNREIIGYLTLIRDVTSRVKAREEKKRMEEHMRYIQKLESLGIMAGGIAHDFNNFLMSILGNAELAQFEISRQSPAFKNLDSIIRASRSASELCKQMLAYAGKGECRLEKGDINQLVQEMTQMLKAPLSKRITFNVNLCGQVPKVLMDKVQIGQVLMNLVINAAEAIGEQSGEITVSTSYRKVSPDEFADYCFERGTETFNCIILEVRDTGCGMTHDTKSRIFDPFFSTKFTGRGLGMAAVQGIVKAHRGAISVNSTLGKGSTITVMLPLEDSRLDEKTTGQPESESDEWKGNGLVLAVDDESDICSVNSEFLGRMGFDVVIAMDGDSAVEIFSQKHHEITFVLLDYTLPGEMNGDDVFDMIISIDPAAKIILASGHSGHHVIERFTSKGLAGFIQKPYSYNDLEEIVRRVTSQHQCATDFSS